VNYILTHRFWMELYVIFCTHDNGWRWWLSCHTHVLMNGIGGSRNTPMYLWMTLVALVAHERFHSIVFTIVVIYFVLHIFIFIQFYSFTICFVNIPSKLLWIFILFISNVFWEHVIRIYVSIDLFEHSRFDSKIILFLYLFYMSYFPYDMLNGTRSSQS